MHSRSFEQFQRNCGSYHIHKTITKIKLAASDGRDTRNSDGLRPQFTRRMTHKLYTNFHKQTKPNRLKIGYKSIQVLSTPPTAFIWQPSLPFFASMCLELSLAYCTSSYYRCVGILFLTSRACQTLDHRIKSVRIVRRKRAAMTHTPTEQIKRVFLRNGRDVRKTMSTK